MTVPTKVAVDSQGALFIVETSDHRVRKVDTNGIVSTVAGLFKLMCGFPESPPGEGGPANKAPLGGPTSLAIGPNGDLVISEPGINRIRSVRGVAAPGVTLPQSAVGPTTSFPAG